MTVINVPGVATTLATQQFQRFTGAGTYNFVVPSTLVGGVVFVTGCNWGGPGGPGQNSNDTAGGGGGGAGQPCRRYPLRVAPGQTLVITIPAAGTVGAVGGSSTTASALTITGGTDTFPGLQGGTRGSPGAAGAGGAGGLGAGIAGAAGGAAHTNGSAATQQGTIMPSSGGGGGGDPSNVAGNGGGSLNRFPGIGGGLSGGGGGASGEWGVGQPGGAKNVDADQNPTWVGFGGGGAGGGANGKGGPGGPPFIDIEGTW